MYTSLQHTAEVSGSLCCWSIYIYQSPAYCRGLWESLLQVYIYTSLQHTAEVSGSLCCWSIYIPVSSILQRSLGVFAAGLYLYQSPAYCRGLWESLLLVYIYTSLQHTAEVSGSLCCWSIFIPVSSILQRSLGVFAAGLYLYQSPAYCRGFWESLLLDYIYTSLQHTTEASGSICCWSICIQVSSILQRSLGVFAAGLYVYQSPAYCRGLWESLLLVYIYTSLQHTAEVSGSLCCWSIFIPVSSILQRSLGVFAAALYLYQFPAYCRGLWESLLLVYIYTSLQHTAEISGSLCCWSICIPVSSILQRSLGVFAAGLYLYQSPAYCRGLWESLLLVYIYTSLQHTAEVSGSLCCWSIFIPVSSILQRSLGVFAAGLYLYQSPAYCRGLWESLLLVYMYTSLQHTAEVSGSLCCWSIFIPVSSILQRSLGVFAAGLYLYQSPAYCRGLWESLLLVYIYTSLQHTAEVSGSLCCWSIFIPVSSKLQRSLGVFAAGLYLYQSPAYCRGLWESLLLVYIYTSLQHTAEVSGSLCYWSICIPVSSILQKSLGVFVAGLYVYQSPAYYRGLWESLLLVYIYTSLQHTAEVSGSLCCWSIFIPVSSILQRSLGVFAAGLYLYQSPAYCRGLWESLLLVYIYTSLQHTAEVSGSLCCWSIFIPVSSILQRSLGVFAAGIYLYQSPAYCRGLWESLLLVYIYTSLQHTAEVSGSLCCWSIFIPVSSILQRSLGVFAAGLYVYQSPAYCRGLWESLLLVYMYTSLQHSAEVSGSLCCWSIFIPVSRILQRSLGVFADGLI